MPPVTRGRSEEDRCCIWSKDEIGCGHGEPEKERELCLNGETAVEEVMYGRFQPTRCSPKRMTEFLTTNMLTKVSCTVDLTMPEAIPPLVTSVCNNS